MMCKFISLLLILLLSNKRVDAAVSVDRLQEHFEVSDNAVDKMMGSKMPRDNRLPNAPSQKTVICPGEAAANLYSDNVQALGQRTRFVIKNTASEPVVVAYVERNGTEYSAAHQGITPANRDPDAFLAPGMAKVFAVHEGHVFHIRDAATRELLMQHRAGIVPITNRFNQIFDCGAGEDVNVPAHDSTYRAMRKFPGWRPAQLETFDKEVDMEIGFQNKVLSISGKQCPVNLYFVKKQQKQHHKPNYVEKFSFHLGANNQLVGDLIWDAAMKHESTFLGHEFVVRLASDENIVVDHLAIAPEKVIDCSMKKKNTVKNAARMTTAIVIPVGLTDSSSIETEVNQTHAEQFLQRQNTTEGGRSFYFKLLSE